MPVIRLADSVINRIAAGEVIERPASVAKELIENAIDAGARRIDVVTAAGGKALLRVADDGTGMTRADLELAVCRHCTSKLSDPSLVAIRTLGFRGEALPSIGAVARLSLDTRHGEEESGWRLSVEGGRVGAPAPSAHPKGTVVEVRDLFFATPARLKFLKSDRSESAAVTEVVKRLALSHPGIHFTLSGSDRMRSDYPAAASRDPFGERAAQVMGKGFLDNALEVAFERDGVRLDGLIGLPTYSRPNTSAQFVFVNGRMVRDRLLYAAIRAGYADVLPKDRSPVLILALTVEPETVDVNVHPAKAEVRFRDAERVRGTVVSALRARLAASDNRTATTTAAAALAALAGGRVGAAGAGARFQGMPAPRRDWDRLERAFAPPPGRPDGFREAQAAFGGLDAPSLDRRAALDEPDPEALGRPLGAARAQFHENYILAQTADGVVIVDQHAAHERIVYERLKAAREANGVATQALLVPAIVELPAEDVARLAAHAEEFAALGLVLESFGPGAVAVREIPALLARLDVRALVEDLAADLDAFEATSRLEERLNQVAATMACHGSVRSGRRLKPEEMDALLREIEATPNAAQCNHGRPTFVELKLADIERLFQRR